VTCPPRRKPEENREREIKQTLDSPHKGKRNSVTIMGCRGNAYGIVISVGICICITVTANCSGLEFGGGHVECVDRCRVILDRSGVGSTPSTIYPRARAQLLSCRGAASVPGVATASREVPGVVTATPEVPGDVKEEARPYEADAKEEARP
jgi:hypothetical protein